MVWASHEQQQFFSIKSDLPMWNAGSQVDDFHRLGSAFVEWYDFYD